MPSIGPLSLSRKFQKENVIVRTLSFFMLILALGACSLADPATAETNLFELPDSRSHKLYSERLDRSYPVFVSLPPGYDAKEDKSYPLVLVNDAPYAFPVAAGSLNVPMNAGKFEEVILAGIGFAEGDHPMASRMRDYTPTHDPNWAQFNPGQARAYMDFIENEVLPFLEATYNIAPTCRTLVGHSAGGLFGAWVLLKQPDLFESYILISPALFYDNKVLFEYEETFAETHADLAARVYFAVGSTERPPATPFEWVKDQESFVQKLKQRNYPSLKIQAEVISGGWHETVFPQGFMRGAQWLFGADKTE